MPTSLTLSVKQRALLHDLLHGDLRKVSASALDACQRAGWSLGSGGGHQLTRRGRHLAELSEEAPGASELELSEKGAAVD